MEITTFSPTYQQPTCSLDETRNPVRSLLLFQRDEGCAHNYKQDSSTDCFALQAASRKGGTTKNRSTKQEKDEIEKERFLKLLFFLFGGEKNQDKK